MDERTKHYEILLDGEVVGHAEQINNGKWWEVYDVDGDFETHVCIESPSECCILKEITSTFAFEKGLDPDVDYISVW